LRKSFKFLEINENGNTKYKNPWNSAKVVPRRKVLTTIAYVRKTNK
jgi:hypothetical protein